MAEVFCEDQTLWLFRLTHTHRLPFISLVDSAHLSIPLYFIPSVFPSHFAHLSVSLLILIGLEAFLLCLLSLLCIWEQPSPLTDIIYGNQTYFGSHISLTGVLERHHHHHHQWAQTSSSVCLMGLSCRNMNTCWNTRYRTNRPARFNIGAVILAASWESHTDKKNNWHSCNHTHNFPTICLTFKHKECFILWASI